MGVITGRCIPDIRAKVDIRNITYAGNHGVDIRHPDGTRFVPPMPEEVRNFLGVLSIEKVVGSGFRLQTRQTYMWQMWNNHWITQTNLTLFSKL